MSLKTLVNSAVVLAFAGAVLATVAVAQDIKFFRIGTGGTAGTYYPIGGLLSNAISNPPGSRECDKGGSCGVPGLVATAVASNGSVANIKTVADLKGKRVSLDEPGSGTLVDARIILAAFGITEKDIKAEYLKPNQAGDKLRDGGLDAFFFVGGYPTGAISELASAGGGVDLVPVTGPEVDKMRAQYGFFAPDTIPANTYKGIGEVKTISVGAQWVTSTKQSDELIYGVTKALWNENTRKLLDAGHAKGKAIQTATATAGAGIPFHPGAEKFYKEKGMLK